MPHSKCPFVKTLTLLPSDQIGTCASIINIYINMKLRIINVYINLKLKQSSGVCDYSRSLAG